MSLPDCHNPGFTRSGAADLTASNVYCNCVGSVVVVSWYYTELVVSDLFRAKQPFPNFYNNIVNICT